MKVESARALTKGSIYFIVMYVDEGLTIPVVQTLRFDEVRDRQGSVEYLFSEFFVDREPEKFLIPERDIESLVLDRHELIERLSGL